MLCLVLELSNFFCPFNLLEFHIFKKILEPCALLKCSSNAVVIFQKFDVLNHRDIIICVCTYFRHYTYNIFLGVSKNMMNFCQIAILNLSCCVCNLRQSLKSFFFCQKTGFLKKQLLCARPENQISVKIAYIPSILLRSNLN